MLHQVPPGGACGTHRCAPQRSIARILRRSKGTPTAVDCLDGTGDAKAVIGVLEFRRNTGPRRDSRDLDVVAPRPATRSAPAALCSPRRIPLRRMRVVTHIVPIGAPLVHVVSQVVEAEGAGRVQSDALRPVFPTLAVIGNLLGGRVAPGIQRAFRAAPRGMLPFGLGGETIIPSR